MRNCLSPHKPVHVGNSSHFSSEQSKSQISFSLHKRLIHLCSKGKLKEAVFIAQNEPIFIRPKTYTALLNSCIDSCSIELGRKVHSCINVSKKKNYILETKLVSMYAKCGSLEDARRVFDEMRKISLITWTAMIGAYVREERWDKAIHLFYLMMHQGVTPDSFLLPRIVQACASIGDYKTGKLLHSIAERKGFFDPKIDTHLANSVLSMYMKCGQLDCAKKFFSNMAYKNLVSWNSFISGLFQCGKKEEAIRVFDLMRLEGLEPDVFTWNILTTHYSKFENSDYELAINMIKQMEQQGIHPNVFTWTSFISGFVQNDKYRDARKMFDEMLSSKVEPNGMTIATVISACASQKWLSDGKILHCYAIKRNLTKTVLVCNSLIGMYAKCENFEEARTLFDKMPERDLISWNSIIAGYAQAGYFSKAFELFSQMEKLGFRRNAVTWNAVISACFHSGDVDQAMDLVNKMERNGTSRSTVSWNILIAGMSKNGYFDEALNIFRKMLFQKIPKMPNYVTILSIVPVLAYLVCSSKVREIHGFIMRTNLLNNNTRIMNAFIDAYAKSDQLDYALVLFHAVKSKTLISWNSIISSCVLHGRVGTALDLFHHMKLAGMRPNHTTIVSILNAYNTEGLVREAEELFGTMSEQYGLNPNSDHFACMVNIYGHAGRLKDAMDLLNKMPNAPDASVWSALLKAAHMNGDLQFMKLVEKNLKLEEPRIGISVYNTYALREKDKVMDKADMKYRGCCYVEVKNKVHCFANGETKYEIKTKVSELMEIAVNNGLELHGVNSLLDDFEEKEEIGRVHSEKQAIAFGIFNSSSYKCIRIIKNGRMCSHCHTFAKLVCKLHKREIVVKDSGCLHRFNNGACSCGDYW